MTNTLASHISASFIIAGEPIYDYGQLASTLKPGDIVYEASAKLWTLVDADTAATLNYKASVVGYKERILATGAKSSIDTAYATTDTGVPILIGCYGFVEFVCHIEDPQNDLFRNARFTFSDTPNVLEGLTAVAAAGAGDTEPNITNVVPLVSGDTYMHARMTA